MLQAPVPASSYSPRSEKEQEQGTLSYDCVARSDADVYSENHEEMGFFYVLLHIGTLLFRGAAINPRF